MEIAQRADKVAKDRILYIGESSQGSTSRHRADALRRLGYKVTCLDPAHCLRGLRASGLLRRLHDLSGQVLMVGMVKKWLKEKISSIAKPDVVWVNDGSLLSVQAVHLLKAFKAPLILYNNDDPTGPRDGRRFFQLRKTIPLYDLCIALRSISVQEIQALGAKRVANVPFSYDEVAHAPLQLNESIGEQFSSDLVFVGTWMRGEVRDVFLEQLRLARLRVSIWGPRWDKSGYKKLVSECWRGAWISEREYVHAIAGAKIAIGMVSKGNRDLHTQRSVEIPYAGGLLCAERTSDHEQMFKEGQEAVFWDSSDECIQQCRHLLANDERRSAIIVAGMRRVKELKVGNEDICRGILAQMFP
jgi:spore maturation protein CgeB